VEPRPKKKGLKGNIGKQKSAKEKGKKKGKLKKKKREGKNKKVKKKDD